jgi:hypothetical protein
MSKKAMIADCAAKPLTVDRAAKIGERAYQLWESEGRPHGRAVDHWLQAEAELEIDAVPQAASGGLRPSVPKPANSKAKTGRI